MGKRSGDKSGTPPIEAGVEGGGPEIVLLDEEGVVIATNHAWRSAAPVRRLSMSRSGVGRRYFDLMREILPDLEEASFRRALDDLRLGGRSALRYPYAIETPTGPIWRQVQVMFLRIGGRPRFVSIHEDMSELVRLQDALRRSSEQVVTAREDERRWLAAELHDSTSQHLAAIGLGLAQLRRLEGEGPAVTVLDQMAVALREAVRETRVISYLMMPRGLLRDGLAPSVRGFAEELARRTGLDIEVSTEGPIENAAPAVQHAALRIVQEALANVHRHAESRSAAVALVLADDVLEVSITDDGCGFPDAGAEELSMGVGVVGMRSRAEQFGGRLEIDSGPQGTRLTARFPLTAHGPALSAARQSPA